MNANLMDKIVALCKRRGFIYPGSEIYGGLSGTWDYGPLGAELKKNIKNEWWNSMVKLRDDVVGIDAAIMMNPTVWDKSGHIQAFTDPLVECKVCHQRFRADKIEELNNNVKDIKDVGDRKYLLFYEKFLDLRRDSMDIMQEGIGQESRIVDRVFAKWNQNKDIFPCPHCLEMKGFTNPRKFNLLVEAELGVIEGKKQKIYLRGEITQGAFVNFQNVVSSTRVKIPFGIAQIGKAFRNEITPGNFTYRSREFEQMELEFFVKPNDNDGDKWFEYWKKQRMDWYKSLGIDEKKLRFRKHEDTERAHYAKYAEDLEYEAPFGWSEFEGIHHRGDYDLKAHDLSYLAEGGEKFTPWVIEASGGVDRSALFFLLDAYTQDGGRTILKLHPKLAPYKVAIFPLLANKEDLVSEARKIYQTLQQDMMVAWDERGNIGKRYFAQDEAGTPYCVTVDFQTLEDKTVTVRDRDSAKQERIKIDKLPDYFSKKLK